MTRRDILTALTLSTIDPTTAFALSTGVGTPTLPVRDAKAAGLLPEPIGEAEAAVAEGVATGGIPGAVFVIVRNGVVAVKKAFGNAVLGPEPVPMRTDTVFDLASLTKVVATTPAVALLVESGKLKLDDTAATYLPAFAEVGGNRAAQDGPAKITVRHLLTHTAGIPAGGAYAGKTVTLAEVVQNIARSREIAAPGTTFLYSDYSAIALQAIIETISGQTLDVFCRERIFAPLGMSDTVYRPSGPLAARCAATNSIKKREDRSEKQEVLVHDPTARAMGGVSGNAGLFSTADDLSRFCQMWLNGGEFAGVRILQPETVRLFTAAQIQWADGERALGWDRDSGYSIRGALPYGSFGHTGYTGTSVWIDPRTKTFILLLTNAVHANSNRGAIIPLRRRVSNLVANALPSVHTKSSEKRGDVLTGLDILQAEAFRSLEKRNLGVVCNPTAVDRLGRHLADLLVESKRGNVVAFFGPEHSIRGDVDASADDSKDPKTGLPVYSLYNLNLPKEQRYRPTAEQLTGVDTLIFDIQDIGARYYTYIATLGYCLEEAAKRGIRVVVLDRPNPLGGHLIEGPLLDPAFAGGFTTYHTMPITHGMTVGELAQMFNRERGINAQLEVVRLKHWTRAMLYDQIGLPWVNPSPNMRSLRQALLYPGVGLLEVLPISVGRGTDTPFEILGAPFIDPVDLSENLTARHLSGVTFTPVRFTPTGSVHKGQRCGGVQIHLWQRDGFLPSVLGIHLADALARLYPDSFSAPVLDRMKTMVGNATIPAALAQGRPPTEIIASWKKDVETWRTRRKPFLLYE